MVGFRVRRLVVCGFVWGLGFRVRGKELKLSYPNRDIKQIIWFIKVTY